MAVTRPSCGAFNSFCIFMASITTTPCAALTSSPTPTSIRTIFPGIAATIVARPCGPTLWRGCGPCPGIGRGSGGGRGEILGGGGLFKKKKKKIFGGGVNIKDDKEVVSVVDVVERIGFYCVLVVICDMVNVDKNDACEVLGSCSEDAALEYITETTHISVLH